MQYPHLTQLFGAYFHEDWTLDDSDWPEALQRYIRDTDEASVRSACAELRALLKEPLPEEVLTQRLHSGLGCYYNAASETDWSSTRQWLEAVLMRLLAGTPEGR